MPRTTVLLTVTTDLIGLLAGYLSGQVHGFTALAAFTDMSITGLILITVRLDRYPSAGRSVSTTSTQTKRGMGEATLAPLLTKGRLSTRSPDIGVVAMLVDTAAGITRAQSGRSERRDKASRYVLSRCAKNETRRNQLRMETLLQPDFTKFGRSGIRYSRAEILTECRQNALSR